MSKVKDKEQPSAAKSTSKTAKGNGKAAKSTSKAESAYGASVFEMCKEPDMSHAELVKRLEKYGIDVKQKHNAVQTGRSAVRKIVKLLRENKLMK